MSGPVRALARQTCQTGHVRRPAHTERVHARDGPRTADADALRPARVLARDDRLGRLPVAVSGDQVDERLAAREVDGGVAEDAARGPEVGVRVLVVVVEEVEEAEVALEGATIGRLVPRERLAFGYDATQRDVDRPRAEEAG